MGNDNFEDVLRKMYQNTGGSYNQLGSSSNQTIEDIRRFLMKPIKYLFISQPMSGLTNDEILNVRQKATQFISDKYPDNEILVLPSYKEQPDNTYNATSAVNLLGNAISLMAKANVIYFVPGWQKSKGCQIENEVARRWLEETGVELIEDGMEKVDAELTPEQLETLKSEADKAGMSVHKFINLKLQQAMTDGTFEKIAEEIKERTNEPKNEELSFAKRSFPNYEWHYVEDMLPSKEENGNLIVQLDQGTFPWRGNCSYKHFDEGYAFTDIN